MKNKKIAILSIASVLSFSVVAGSLALYQQFDDTEKSTIINGGIKEKGAYTLTAVGELPTQKLSLNEVTGAKSLNYKYNLGYDKAKSPLYKQDNIYGKLTITVKSVGIKTLYDNKSLIVLPTFGGYEGTYWLGEQDKINQSLVDNVQSTADSLTFILDEVAFNYNNAQFINLNIALGEGVTDFDTFATIAEKTFEYSITLEDSAKECPFIRGDINNWECNDAYKMSPNLGKKDGFEWWYSGLNYNGLAGAETTYGVKAYLSTNGDNGGYEGNPGDANHNLTKGTNYNVYWNGANLSAANFAEAK